MNRNPSIHDYRVTCRVCACKFKPGAGGWGTSLGAAIFDKDVSSPICPKCDAKEGDERARKKAGKTEAEWEEEKKREEEKERKRQQFREAWRAAWRGAISSAFDRLDQEQSAEERREQTSKPRRITDRFHGKFSHPVVFNPRRWPNASEIQTLLFDKKIYSTVRAKAWARRHDFAASNVDVGSEGARYLRIRQKSPDKFKPGRLRTITLTDGIQAVIGEPVSARKNSGVKERETPLVLVILVALAQYAKVHDLPTVGDRAPMLDPITIHLSAARVAQGLRVERNRSDFSHRLLQDGAFLKRLVNMAKIGLLRMDTRQRQTSVLRGSYGGGAANFDPSWKNQSRVDYYFQLTEKGAEFARANKAHWAPQTLTLRPWHARKLRKPRKPVTE